MARMLRGIKGQVGGLPPDKARAEVTARFNRARARYIAKTVLDFAEIRDKATRDRVFAAVQRFAGGIEPLLPGAGNPEVVRRLDAIDAEFKVEILRILGREKAEEFLKNYFDIEIE